jgi:ribosomal protein L37AE/L43A/5S rRNA maturation endonuclease (ribonuclease M5)
MTPIEFHTGFQPTEKMKHEEGKESEPLHVYDCPFCEKTQHLYFFPSNTVWDCKACGKSGNVHVFNQLIYNDVCTKSVDELVHSWKLPRRVFEGVKYNPLNGTYVIPTYRNNKQNNLYKYIPEINKIFGTPGLPATLYNWTDDAFDEIWICEGQKDKLAGDAIRGSRSITTVGIPGANMFKEGWASAFQGKEVTLIFDNDQAGQNGKKRVLEIFKNSPFKPKKVSEVIWPENTAKGYDLRDHYIEHKGQAFALLNQYIEEVKQEELCKVVTETIIADSSCDSYDKALKVFSDTYHLTTDMRYTLALVLASIYSNNLGGEQVWIKLIGPPGCGKSTISKAVSASDYVVNKSTFTGLFSGWKDGEDKDPSLIPIIAGRTLIVKDADALLRQGNIEKIMSELRDFYDKDSSIHYNNRQSYEYQGIRSTFIMMGTQVLRRSDQSFLGERLLTIEMNITPEDEAEIKNRVMYNSIAAALGSEVEPETKVMASMKGWIDHLKEKKLEATIQPEFQQEIMQLCSLTALMRTQVDRDFKGKMLSPAIPELPTRLIGQIVKATLSLCVVFDLKEPNDEVRKIIKKVLRDTINPRSHRFLLCDVILDNPGIRAIDLIGKTGLDKNIIADELRDLKELRFVTTKEVPGTSVGYTTQGYVLHEKIANPFKEIIQ